MIVLATDFGYHDTYVGEMKGRIHSFASDVRLVDLTHSILPGNIMHGQFQIQFSYRVFPEDTVFLCVVDPGVGSSRKCVAVYYDERWFVGPDNGLLSFAESGVIYTIQTEDRTFFPEVSATFHGRDIFAVAAAMLDKRDLRCLKKAYQLEVLTPVHLSDHVEPSCRVLHIDSFGNIVTSVDGKLFGKVGFVVNDMLISESAGCFEDGNSECFVIMGSKGLLEIVSRQKKASEILNLDIHAEVEVKEI